MIEKAKGKDVPKNWPAKLARDCRFDTHGHTETEYVEKGTDVRILQYVGIIDSYLICFPDKSGLGTHTVYCDSEDVIPEAVNSDA